jgi:hypothetical protein
MHGCGSGRRLSSLRIFVSSCSRISSVSAASLSRDRLEDVRHVDYFGEIAVSITHHTHASAPALLLICPLHYPRGWAYQ